jgi:hypothetical protein
MMMDSNYHHDMQNPGMYNTQLPIMSQGTFDPTNAGGMRGAPSPAFNNRSRSNSNFDPTNGNGSQFFGHSQSELDIPMGNVSQVSMPPMIPAGFPSDDEILNEIKAILATANLMSITKKQGKFKHLIIYILKK